MKKNIFIGLATNIILSLIYSILASLLIYYCVSPVISPLKSVFSLITGNNMQDNITINSIYVPNDEIEPDFVYDDITGALVEVQQHLESNITYTSEIQFPRYGEMYGELSIESAGITLDLYMGDNLSLLKLGVGQFYASTIPGMAGKTIIAGHNTSPYFGPLAGIVDNDELVGQIIKISTSYGNFYYQIYDYDIKNMNDTSAFLSDDNNKDKDTLVMYTCYPFTLGYKSERIYMYAEKIAGRDIVIG